MKKKVLFILLIIVLLVLILGTAMYLVDMDRIKHNKPVIFSNWGYDYAPPENIDSNQIEEAIKTYILNLDANSPKYNNEKEFVAMKIYLIEEKNDTDAFVYAWVLEESFYEQGEEKIKESGASIPYKFKLRKNEINYNNYEVVSHEIPRDGSYYLDDMKSMFPKSVLNDMNKVYTDGTIEELNADIEKQVNEYRR